MRWLHCFNMALTWRSHDKPWSTVARTMRPDVADGVADGFRCRREMSATSVGECELAVIERHLAAHELNPSCPLVVSAASNFSLVWHVGVWASAAIGRDRNTGNAAVCDSCSCEIAFSLLFFVAISLLVTCLTHSLVCSVDLTPRRCVVTGQ